MEHPVMNSVGRLNKSFSENPVFVFGIEFFLKIQKMVFFANDGEIKKLSTL